MRFLTLTNISRLSRKATKNYSTTERFTKDRYLILRYRIEVYIDHKLLVRIFQRHSERITQPINGLHYFAFHFSSLLKYRVIERHSCFVVRLTILLNESKYVYYALHNSIIL